MNKALRLIWITAGCFVAMTLIALLVFYLVGMQYMPVNFWSIPVLFLVLTLVLGLITKKYSADKKDVSIANILGIRVFFISLIGVALVISILIDRAHILPLAVIFAVFTIVFSYFETQVLLMLNKKNY